MRGMGIIEMLIAVVVLIVLVVVIVLIVKAVSKPNKQYLQDQAYQRLAQLDDLHKRGVLSDAEYEQKKQEAMKDL